MLTGRTDSNKVVIFKGNDKLINTMQNIKIISQHMWYLKGQIKITTDCLDLREG